MRETSSKNGQELSEALRNGLRSDLNRRSLSRVTGLELDRRIPDRFQALLGELEMAERGSSRRRA